jgi:hypothetical protein
VGPGIAANQGRWSQNWRNESASRDIARLSGRLAT